MKEFKNIFRLGRVVILVVMGFIIIACTSPVREKPPITPYWALGHLVWEDSINTQEAAQKLVESYFEHELPVGGIIIDSPWSQSYNDFNWDRDRYPEPEEMIRLFDLGFDAASKGYPWKKKPPMLEGFE